MRKIDLISDRQNRFIFDRWIRPRITPGIIEEHRSNPFGKHSPDLDIVMNYFRRSPDPLRRAYVIVKIAPGEYQIGEAPWTRGQPIRMIDDQIFGSEQEAEHGAFLRQLADAGIDPSGVVD